MGDLDSMGDLGNETLGAIDRVEKELTGQTREQMFGKDNS